MCHWVRWRLSLELVVFQDWPLCWCQQSSFIRRCYGAVCLVWSLWHPSDLDLCLHTRHGLWLVPSAKRLSIFIPEFLVSRFLCVWGGVCVCVCMCVHGVCVCVFHVCVCFMCVCVSCVCVCVCVSCVYLCLCVSNMFSQETWTQCSLHGWHCLSIKLGLQDYWLQLCLQGLFCLQEFCSQQITFIHLLRNLPN